MEARRGGWSRGRRRQSNHAAAASYGGSLYVVGGYTSGLGGETAALRRYEPGRDRRVRLADAPTARGALAAGVVGGRLYVAGGARAGKALKTLEIYDVAGGRWRTGLRCGSRASTPRARCSAARSMRSRAAPPATGASGLSYSDRAEALRIAR
jgi:hypothetical protein